MFAPVRWLAFHVVVFASVTSYEHHDRTWHPQKDTRSPQDIMVDVVNDLGLNILKIHNTNNENNIAISPYGVASILTALLEGTKGRAAIEIQKCGGFPADRDVIRVGLRDIHRLLRSYFIPQEGFLSGLSLSSEQVTLKPEYQSILRFYGFDMTSFNTPIYPNIETTTPMNNITTMFDDETTSETTTSQTTTEEMTTIPTTLPTTIMPTTMPTTVPTTMTTTIMTTTEQEARTMQPETTLPTTTTVPTTTQQTTTNPTTTQQTTTNPPTTNVPTTTLLPETTTETTTAQVRTTRSVETTTVGTTITNIGSTFTTSFPTTLSNIGSTFPTTYPTTLTNIGSTFTTSYPTTFPTTYPTTTNPTTYPTTTNPTTYPTTTNPTTTNPTTTNPTTTNPTTTNPTTTYPTTTYPTTTFPTTTFPTTTVGGEATTLRIARVGRSIVDYFIARYYDDHTSDIYNEPVNKQHAFLVNGKYHETHVHFMTYDVVLPFYYVHNLNALALRFPLDSPKYYLLLVLPVDEEGIDKLICDIGNAVTLKQIVSHMRPTYIRAVIPSFMLRGFVILTSSLQKIGIQQIFEPRHTDFSPMTDDKDIYVTNIEQAITVMIKNYMDPSMINKNRNLYQYGPVEFKATHPFLYFVMDSELDVTLVAGKIVNPINSRIQ